METEHNHEDFFEHETEGHEHEHESLGHNHEGHDHDHDHEGHAHDGGHAHDHGHCDCGHDHDECSCGCNHHHEQADEHELSGKPSFSYHVLGVDCPNCALGVQNAVRALGCVEDARLVYATATLDVVAAPSADLAACKREVLKTVRSCGEDLELTPEELRELEAERSWFSQNREQILMGLSAFALVAGLITEYLVRNEQRAIVCYIVATLSGLVFIAPMAFASLRRRTADMNVLMGIAVLGALAIGFTGDSSVFFDAALVIFLDQVGEWLEGWSMRKTSGSVRELMELVPSVAHVVTPEGTTVNVQTKGVAEGYVIRVLPGERVPLDGVVVAGESSFNEAPVTGESMPQDKGVGAEIYAGTLNINAAIDMRVTADEDCSTLARVVSQVQGAQAQKAPYESFVNRFAAVYTPVVVAGALVLGVAVPLYFSVERGVFDATLWHDWVYRACSLLVVACPCALVISTPVSFVSALSCAAKNGVLVKGGAYFDIATHVNRIAVDKTGTLTTGNPSVTEIITFEDAREDEVLAMAYALEASSTHPLARAIVAEAERRGVAMPSAQNVEEVAGHGMRGMVDGWPCAVGKLAFAHEEANLLFQTDAEAERLGHAGATTVVVVCAGEAVGVIGIADTLRESVLEVLQDLREGGARRLEMLTGDNTHAAVAIAAQAGIDEVSAELLPSDKLERIKKLQDEGAVVAMVGDGINDAPALATADLGITMGAAASDTALEVADVALLSDSLEQLPMFFQLAVRTMHIVRENIGIAIGVKLLVFVLVVLGVAGMGAAVFADTGVALLVVLNGMRLMRDSYYNW